MHEPYRIADYVIEIAHIHRISIFVEPERPSNWKSGFFGGNFLIATSDVLEMVCQYVHQLKFQTFFAPQLPKVCRAHSSFFRYSVN